ncbi:hypothetical protein LMIY3S_00204 [Labrys miyagiensis]
MSSSDRDQIVAAAIERILARCDCRRSGLGLVRYPRLYNEIIHLHAGGEAQITVMMLTRNLKWTRDEVRNRLEALVKMGVIRRHERWKNGDMIVGYAYKPVMNASFCAQ